MIYILSIIAIFLNSQLLASINSLSRARDDFKNVLNITAKVGSSVTLKCSIDSITYGNGPGIIWTKGKLGNVLTLNSNRITADSRFNVHNTQTRLLYRNNEATKNFDLTIDNVKISDENEYYCETSGYDENSMIHTLVYLKVIQSPSFIEEKTSSSNIISNENENTTLACYASGRPEPIIKWYKVDKSLNTIQDLNYESNSLIIINKYHKNHYSYECIATNGIEPSVSKRFTLTVLFSPVVYSLQFQIFQSIGQSATLGCNIISYPESSIIWFKNDQIIVNNSDKYEIKTLSHTNQTISYLKVNHLETNDFGRYKCEASNQIGKKWQNIYLVEIKNFITSKLPHKNNHHNHATHHHKQKISTNTILTTTSLSNIIENTENYDIDYEIDYFKSFNSTYLLKNQKHNESNMFIIRKKNHKRRKHNKTLEFHLKNQLVDDENDDLNVYLSELSSSSTTQQKINSNIILVLFMYLCF